MADSLPKGGGFLLEKVGERPGFIPEHLSDEQRQLAKLVLDFIVGDVAPKSEEIENKNYAVTLELMKKAGQLGLLAAALPEAYGGLDVDKVTTVAMGENAVIQGSFGVTMLCHTGIGSWPLTYFGTKEQKEKYLPKLGTGELIGAYCLTEPGSGSDALGMRTRATLTPDGAHWILNGEKIYITNGGFADLFTVFAKVDGDDKKVTAFLIEKGTPGLSTGKEEKKLGIKGSSTVPVFMENCKIPVGNLLGQLGKGHKIAFNILNLGRFKLGIGATGMAKYLIGEAVKYGNQRNQFKQPITKFELIQKKLANMAMLTFVSESMNYYTAGLMDQRIGQLDKQDDLYTNQVMDIVEEFAVESSIAKIFGSEVVDYVCDEGIQLLGGYGYIEEYPFAPAFRNTRINRIFEGTNEINRMLIPGMLIKMAMKGSLDLMGAIGSVVGELKQGWSKTADGPLADEIHQAELAKKLTIYLSGCAVQKFMQNLNDRQYLLEFMADITTIAYGMTTSIGRALQLLDDLGEAQCETVLALVKTYVTEQYEAILVLGRRMLLAVADGNGEEFDRYEKALKRFEYPTRVDTTKLRGIIARKIIAEEKYALV